MERGYARVKNTLVWYIWTNITGFIDKLRTLISWLCAIVKCPVLFAQYTLPSNVAAPLRIEISSGLSKLPVLLINLD